MPQLGFHVNIDRCIGCRACEGACKQEFDLPMGVRRRRVLVQEGEDSDGLLWMRFVSLACNHCEKPACVAACPQKRLWKDDPTQPDLEHGYRAKYGITATPTGLVLIAPSKEQDPTNGVDCIGCRRCIAACPYGAMQWDPVREVSDKCTGCYHRLQNANLPEERRKPACVLSCSALTLHFDELTVIEGGAYGAAPTRYTTAQKGGVDEPLQIANVDMTNPSIRFTPHRRVP